MVVWLDYNGWNLDVSLGGVKRVGTCVEAIKQTPICSGRSYGDGEDDRVFLEIIIKTKRNSGDSAEAFFFSQSSRSWHSWRVFLWTWVSPSTCLDDQKLELCDLAGEHKKAIDVPGIGTIGRIAAHKEYVSGGVQWLEGLDYSRRLFLHGLFLNQFHFFSFFFAVTGPSKGRAWRSPWCANHESETTLSIEHTECSLLEARKSWCIAPINRGNATYGNCSGAQILLGASR